MIAIGIDPGTHTGFAVWDGKEHQFLELETLPIHKAMQRVLWFRDMALAYNVPFLVVFEDARKRTWFGPEKNTRAKLQGAGSIKRDCSIWEDFCKDHGIPFQAIAPIKGGTKLSKEYFAKLTGYKGQTSNHARDAAILVLGR